MQRNLNIFFKVNYNLNYINENNLKKPKNILILKQIKIQYLKKTKQKCPLKRIFKFNFIKFIKFIISIKIIIV